jgi:ABC-2 family transporter protein
MQDERVMGFKSETDIWNYIEDLGSRSFIVIFHVGNETHFDYTIKSKSNRFMTDRHYSKDLNAIASKVTNEYVNYGFLGIQYALDTTYYEMAAKVNEVPYVIQVERMPSLSQDPIASQIDNLGLFIIIFSALICIALIFTRMVEEKACGFREQLKNATRFSYLNNVALFVVNHVQMTFLFWFCLFIAYFKSVWISVNFFYPLLLTFLFITSLIAFTFLVSAFFESSEYWKMIY